MNFIPLGKSIYNNKDLFPKNYSKETYNNKNVGDSPSHFKIIKLLGKGALGKVYKVRSLIDNQIYAMKIFDKELETIRKNLEIKLSHPHIVKIYNHFEDANNKKIYVIMEYIANGNLKDFIALNNSSILYNILSDSQILNFILQTIWSLYYIHNIQENKGYFLGNIKPENILIDDNLHIKLGEFLSTITPIENEDIGENPKHYYEKITTDSDDIKDIWKRTKKYLAKSWKCRAGDVYSLGLVLKELLEYDGIDIINSRIFNILNNMSEEECINNETLGFLFIEVTNIFSDEQKNSSIESIVLCLKSFTNWSNEIKKGIAPKENIKKTKTGNEKNLSYSTSTTFGESIKSNYGQGIKINSGEINNENIIKNQNFEKIEDNTEYENEVVKKYNEILNLIYDKNENFIKWYKFINELRLELNNEIDDLETLNEIDPNEVYLYLVNLIINEVRKKYLKANSNNERSLNIKNENDYMNWKYIIDNSFDFECPGIQKILGLMRMKSTCKGNGCNFTQYQFNKFILLEIDPNKILNEKKMDENEKKLFDIEQFFNEENIRYKKLYRCSQCNKETEHECINEVYSLPESLAISIKRTDIEQNYINIKETIEIKDLDKNKDNKKTYELVALLKYNRENKKILYYTFSKFREEWFLCQSHRGIEQINMNKSHLRSRNVRMVFYQAK